MGRMEDYKYLFKVGTSLAIYASYFLLSIINACALAEEISIVFCNKFFFSQT